MTKLEAIRPLAEAGYACPGIKPADETFGDESGGCCALSAAFFAAKRRFPGTAAIAAKDEIFVWVSMEFGANEDEVHSFLFGFDGYREPWVALQNNRAFEAFNLGKELRNRYLGKSAN